MLLLALRIDKAMYKDQRVIEAESSSWPTARKWGPQIYSQTKLNSANNIISLKVESFLEPKD